MNNTSSLKIKLICLLLLIFALLVIAIFADKLVPFDPDVQNLAKALQPPDALHLLGTDRYGRDLLARVIMGAQSSVLTSVGLVMFISVLGTLLGVFCGYRGGRLDDLIMRVADCFLAFPGMVFAIAVAGILGGGIINAVLALALISWPKYTRLARGQTLHIKNMPYIAAAQLSGSGTGRIMGRHILPNIASTILLTATLDIGTVMMELAGLSFLGLGAMPPTAEWGAMLSNGRSMLQTAPWVVLAPGCAIFISVVLFNLLADTLRDALDPKIQQ